MQYRTFYHTPTAVAWHRFMHKLQLPAFRQSVYMANTWRAVNVAYAYEATSAVSSQAVVHVGELIFWTAAAFHYCRKVYAYVRTLDRDCHFAWRKTAGTALLLVEVSRLRTLMDTIDEAGTCAILFPDA